MSIIRITIYETQSEYGKGRIKVIKEKEILFNTNEMISASNYEDSIGGSYIQYKRALVSAYECKQTIEEIEQLIQKSKSLN